MRWNGWKFLFLPHFCCKLCFSVRTHFHSERYTRNLFQHTLKNHYSLMNLSENKKSLKQLIGSVYLLYAWNMNSQLNRFLKDWLKQKKNYVHSRLLQIPKRMLLLIRLLHDLFCDCSANLELVVAIVIFLIPYASSWI